MDRETISAASFIKTPISFLALVSLIVNAILGAVVLKGSEQSTFYIGLGMIAVLLLIIAGVFLRPKSLYGLPAQSIQKKSEIFLYYSESLMKTTEKQARLTKTVQSSLMQLFPQGVPHGVEPKEWQYISSLLSDQSNLAATLLETTMRLNEEMKKK
jgi:hypothetical protein